MDLKARIKDALLELRSASLSLQGDVNDVTLHEFMEKYDLLFLGQYLNVIQSVELLHTLQTVFKVDVDAQTLNAMIPSICKELGMKTEAFVSLEDAAKPNPPISSYSITLF